ncbi:MAG: hypothetical protein AAFP89_27740, partial [Bacteroidota bacterium]
SPSLLPVSSAPEIREAIEQLAESAFTKSELESYDKYWDSISSEKTLISEAEETGRREGKRLGSRRAKRSESRRAKKLDLRRGN